MLNLTLFWSFSLISLFVYIMNKAGYIFPNLIQWYLNDLLVVPIVATLSKWFMRLVLQQSDFILMLWQVVFIVVAFSVIFEMVIPFWMERYTSDPVDVITYTIGGLFYWKVMNKCPAPKLLSQYPYWL